VDNVIHIIIQHIDVDITAKARQTQRKIDTRFQMMEAL